MATPAANSKLRIIILAVAFALVNLLIVSVYKCSHYKSEAAAYQDSTNFYKVESSLKCQEKIDSLKNWYQVQKTKDEETINKVKTDAPDWLQLK